MDWLHCNTCYSPSKKNLYLAGCGHIYCEICSSKLNQICPLCNTPSTFKSISKNINDELRIFFVDARELQASYQRDVADFIEKKQRECIRFFEEKSAQLMEDIHRTHLSKFVHRLMIEEEHTQEKMQNLKEQLRVYKEENEKMEKKVKELKNELEKSREPSLVPRQTQFRYGSNISENHDPVTENRNTQAYKPMSFFSAFNKEPVLTHMNASVPTERPNDNRISQTERYSISQIEFQTPKFNSSRMRNIYQTPASQIYTSPSKLQINQNRNSSVEKHKNSSNRIKISTPDRSISSNGSTQIRLSSNEPRTSLRDQLIGIAGKRN